MARVTLRPGESQEELLKRFRRLVTEDKVLSTYREKRWFISKSELRRKAKRRGLRKMMQQQRKQRERME